MNNITIFFVSKDRELEFNQGAFIEYQEMVDFDSHKSTAAYAMFWAGLRFGAYVNKEKLTKTVPNPAKVPGDQQPETIEVPLTFKDVCTEVDLLDDAVIMAVLKTFQESTAYQKNVKPAISEEEKKSPADIVTDQNVTNLPEG